MIRSLHIENYALIGRLDIELHSGFSVITGETGAGKSIILGALGLLRGQRADTKAIKRGEKRCVVEAEFDVSQYGLERFFTEHDLDFDGQSCIIRRELTAAGKSRGFINDTPVPLTLLKDLGDSLIDIHSQHQNLLLGHEDFQLNVLDTVAQNRPLLTAYQTTFGLLRQARQELREAEEQAGRNREEEDYLRFQFAKIDEAQLHAGEQEALEAESEMLTHAEEIKQELYEARQCVESDGDDADVLGRLRQALTALHAVSGKLPAAQELAGRIDSCYIELKDVAEELEQRAEAVEYNPARLDIVNERLNVIYDLERKHHVETVEQLLALGEELSRRLADIDNSDERTAALQARCRDLQTQAEQQAAQLSATRRKAGQEVARRMETSLRPLGMPNVRFDVQTDFRTDRLTASGGDAVTFRFSANRNGDLQDVAHVASGGEIARVMLSLKALLASAVKLPTIIFDEIDTGISGSTAEKMARMMRDMGDRGRQVISITHLPQIAAMGAHHYRVYKEDNADTTSSHIAELTGEERVEEIAHMLSGEHLTEAAVENAKELLTH